MKPFSQSHSIPPSTLSRITPDFGESDARDFNVFFSARNGFFTQILRFRRVGGQWLSATTVTSMALHAVDKNPVLRQIADGYPTDANGNPDGI